GEGGAVAVDGQLIARGDDRQAGGAVGGVVRGRQGVGGGRQVDRVLPALRVGRVDVGDQVGDGGRRERREQVPVFQVLQGRPGPPRRGRPGASGQTQPALPELLQPHSRVLQGGCGPWDD